jgi:putative alpha-1,2-mannosidase
MNFEEHTQKSIGRFLSGTSSRRFTIGIALVGILLIGALIKKKSEATEKNPVDLVNPLMGTDSEFKLSNGNTYPAIALPWGMNFWTPQTRNMGNGWGYTYDGD